MSDDVVREFYEYLVGSAEKMRAEYEKPIFMMAALKYILKNNLQGITLDELMYQEHARGIRDFYLRVGRKKLKAPENSWRRITNPRNPEMKRMFEKYSMNRTDFDRSFAELKPYQVQQLLSVFMDRINLKDE
ncbi:MAG: hypothetical protein ACFFED_13870 [Candidatus Thorarchaeota archaeon]